MTRPKKSARRSITVFSGLVVPMTRSLTIASTISRARESPARSRDRAGAQRHGLMRSIESGRLGLPRTIRACLFDLDGVLTRTARVHATAWKEMFDAFLRDRAAQREEPFVPFDPLDYRGYIDGKLRYDGVRSFLTSRGIELPEGAATDPSDATT